jgi:hypothetical protein
MKFFGKANSAAPGSTNEFSAQRFKLPRKRPLGGVAVRFLHAYTYLEFFRISVLALSASKPGDAFCLHFTLTSGDGEEEPETIAAKCGTQYFLVGQ